MRSIMLLLFIVLLALAFSIGCSSRQERAKKLFEAGKYEEVIENYPEEPVVVHDARCKIAEKLLGEGRYREILDRYGDTPSVDIALEKIAEALLHDGAFDKVVLDYSSTAAADVARDSLAARLYREKKIRKVLEAYPTTKAAEDVDKYHAEVRKAIEREEEHVKAQLRKEEKRKQAACRLRPSLCLRIGMNQSGVRDLSGLPNDINRSVFSSLGQQHVNEQWVYESSGNYSYEAAYIFFEDGILTSWQE